MLRCYIAGKISGEDEAKAKVKFDKATEIIKQRYMMPVNPMVLVGLEKDWNKCMRICLKSLLTCDAICLLDDWKDSKGAKLEENVARGLDMLIIHLEVPKDKTINNEELIINNGDASTGSATETVSEKGGNE